MGLPNALAVEEKLRSMDKQEQIKEWSRLYGHRITEKEYPEISKIVKGRKSSIKKLLNSGALDNFSIALKRYYNKANIRNHLMNEYANIIISNVNYIESFNTERNEQKRYLVNLTSDFKWIDRIKTGRKNINDLTSLFKIKQHIAKYHSNFRFAKKTEYSLYALIFYLNQLFDFPKLKYNERQELVSSIIVFFGLSSAVCYELKRRNDFLKYYPATIENKNIVISEKTTPIRKSSVHRKCNCFEQESNGATHCTSHICIREEQNVEQRLKRSKKLFKRELDSKEFIEYKKKRLSDAIKQNKLKETIPAKLLSKKFLEKKIKGEFIYRNFLLSMERHRSPTDIYIDNLAGILRENNIAGYRAHEFYKLLGKDHEFSDIFKIRFHLFDSKGDFNAAFKTTIPFPVHSH